MICLHASTHGETGEGGGRSTYRRSNTLDHIVDIGSRIDGVVYAGIDGE